MREPDPGFLPLFIVIAVVVVGVPCLVIADWIAGHRERRHDRAAQHLNRQRRAIEARKASGGAVQPHGKR